MTDFFKIDERLISLDKKAREMCAPVFAEIDEISRYNQHKVLAAFINNGEGYVFISFYCLVRKHRGKNERGGD